MDRFYEISPDQRRGQECYRKKEYSKALEYFDSAFSKSVKPTLSLLDNRAATYAKLNDLKSALRDGKQMIQNAKAEVTGYLRAGQVLQMIGKDDLALGIYNYGLKNVPIGHKDIHLLRGMHNKLTAKCSPPKAIDPVSALPLELLVMVLSYLRIHELVLLLRVSRKWRGSLESIPELWRHLDLTHTSKRVSFKDVKAFLFRSKGTLAHATFPKEPNYTDIEKLILVRYKTLLSIELHIEANQYWFVEAAANSPRLTRVIVSSSGSIPFLTAHALLMRCKHLEHAEIKNISASREIVGFRAPWDANFSHLRVLKMEFGTPPEDFFLNKLLEKTLHLRELSLHKCNSGLVKATISMASGISNLESLQRLKLSGFHVKGFAAIPSTLQSLRIENCRIEEIDRTNEKQDSYAHLKNLTDLCFTGGNNTSVVSHLDRLLAPNKGKLRTLNISSHFHLEEFQPVLLDLAKDGYFFNVTDLILTGALVGADEFFECIAEACPSLTTLDASGNPKITGISVKSLVQKSGDKLKLLVLKHCLNVSRDAVDYARANGVTVLFSFPDSKPKKKVR